MADLISEGPGAMSFLIKAVSFALAATVTAALVLVSPLASAEPQASEPGARSEGTNSGRPAGTARSASTVEFDRPFRKSKMKYVQRLDRCVLIVLAGRITGTRERAGRGGTGRVWRDVKIHSPRMTARTYDYYPGPPGRDCTGAAPVRKFVMVQSWKHAGCRPGITGVSGSFPWGISATFGCGGSDDATQRSSVDGSGLFAEQNNPGTVINYAFTSGTGISFKAVTRGTVRIHRKMNGGSRNSRVSATFSVVLPA